MQKNKEIAELKATLFELTEAIARLSHQNQSLKQAK